MPDFLKNLSVEIHRDLRLFFYEFKKDLVHKKCCKNSKEVIISYNQSRRYGPLKHICYAPYTSMFFSRSGRVAPCYASYNEKSSHISDSGIKDIWSSGSFSQIRQEHKECNLTDTCSFCSEIMQRKSFGSLLINKYEHYAFSTSNYPRIMEFELSNQCNLSCIMCDSNLSSGIESENCGQMSGNEFYGEKFLKELEEFVPHLQVAEFTGGDPFMIQEYYQIWEMITRINPKCQILITTNANTMNERIQNLLNSHKNIHFNVSIDSLKKENYEKIRRGGDFENAMENLDLFIEYVHQNKTSINVLVCPMTVNVLEMPDFVEFANEKKICVYYHTVIKPKDLSLKYVQKTEMEETIKILEKHQFSQNSKNEITNNQNYLNLIELLKSWSEQASENNISEIKQQVEIGTLIVQIKSKLTDVNQNLMPKLENLISELESFEHNQSIFKKISEVNNEVFNDYLENKSLEDLVFLCKTLNGEQNA